MKNVNKTILKTVLALGAFTAAGASLVEINTSKNNTSVRSEVKNTTKQGKILEVGQAPAITDFEFLGQYGSVSQFSFTIEDQANPETPVFAYSGFKIIATNSKGQTVSKDIKQIDTNTQWNPDPFVGPYQSEETFISTENPDFYLGEHKLSIGVAILDSYSIPEDTYKNVRVEYKKSVLTDEAINWDAIETSSVSVNHNNDVLIDYEENDNSFNPVISLDKVGFFNLNDRWNSANNMNATTINEYHANPDESTDMYFKFNIDYNSLSIMNGFPLHIKVISEQYGLDDELTLVSSSMGLYELKDAGNILINNGYSIGDDITDLKFEALFDKGNPGDADSYITTSFDTDKTVKMEKPELSVSNFDASLQSISFDYDINLNDFFLPVDRADGRFKASVYFGEVFKTTLDLNVTDFVNNDLTGTFKLDNFLEGTYDTADLRIVSQFAYDGSAISHGSELETPYTIWPLKNSSLHSEFTIGQSELTDVNLIYDEVNKSLDVDFNLNKNSATTLETLSLTNTVDSTNYDLLDYDGDGNNVTFGENKITINNIEESAFAGDKINEWQLSFSTDYVADKISTPMSSDNFSILPIDVIDNNGTGSLPAWAILLLIVISLTIVLLPLVATMIIKRNNAAYATVDKKTTKSSKKATVTHRPTKAEIERKLIRTNNLEDKSKTQSTAKKTTSTATKKPAVKKETTAAKETAKSINETTKTDKLD